MRLVASECGRPTASSYAARLLGQATTNCRAAWRARHTDISPASRVSISELLGGHSGHVGGGGKSLRYWGLHPAKQSGTDCIRGSASVIKLEDDEFSRGPGGIGVGVVTESKVLFVGGPKRVTDV